MRYIEELKQCYLTLEKGYNSMPVNLPGTLFHKAMKARKRLGAVVAHIIEARREGERQRGSDLLASFLDDREALTDAQIADNVIGVIFAARDTTASVLTWMVKFLGDHPAVLKAVIVSSSLPAGSCLAPDRLRAPAARRLTGRAGVVGGAAGDRAVQRLLRRAPDVGGHQADAHDEPCDPGDDAGGVHPVLHLPGGRGGRGVPRVPDPQGLEGDAPVPEHPPQPRPLPLPGEVRPLPIRGCSQAQHVPAVRQRDPLVPGQRARQAGDARALPPPRHQVQVVHLQVRERRAVRPLRAAAQRPAHDLRPQGLMSRRQMCGSWTEPHQNHGRPTEPNQSQQQTGGWIWYGGIC
uniref:Abscisic acid 8'-hydroxylase 1 n=1 Tax=Zea mays TaxID=4577 RepID=A0A804PNC7_MAIZE